MRGHARVALVTLKLAWNLSVTWTPAMRKCVSCWWKPWWSFRAVVRTLIRSGHLRTVPRRHSNNYRPVHSAWFYPRCTPSLNTTNLNGKRWRQTTAKGTALTPCLDCGAWTKSSGTVVLALTVTLIPSPSPCPNHSSPHIRYDMFISGFRTKRTLLFEIYEREGGEYHGPEPEPTTSSSRGNRRRRRAAHDPIDDIFDDQFKEDSDDDDFVSSVW